MKSGIHMTYHTCRDRDGRAGVIWRYHCTKGCDYFRGEDGWNLCDWRVPNTDLCANTHARIDGMRRMIALAQAELRRQEADS